MYLANFVTDPRLYVFLRQQWDSCVKTDNITEILVDTLVLFALEGTNPERNILKTESEIIEEIAKKIQFDPSSITLKIGERLKLLSKKPRKIQYHTKKNAYCLPFETRCEIQDRNLKDAALYKKFRDQSKEQFSHYLGEVKVRDSIDLLESVLHRLFYQQGLEFSSFVLKGENRDAIEKNLVDFISQAVEEKNVITKNRDHVISALHMTIRGIVYNGTSEQKNFLGRLANTYMMLFLLQVDPKVTTYFGQMASELRVYVDNSIIIPALSEYYLPKNNRRYWDLLKKASDAGVKLIVEEQIIEELAYHFSMIQNTYDMIYKDSETMYTDDESLVLYIHEIMIRSYFYAKIKNQVSNFENFIDQFVDFGSKSNNKDNLIILLREEFGISFISSKNIKLNVREEDFQALYNQLKNEKSHNEQARTDARLILTIYEERQQNEETSTSGIFGYKTWWLSSDTTTQKAVNNVFGDRFNTSCYIRPDFLFNFICLAPNIHDVNETFDQLFPSLLGVNISYHLPIEVIDIIQSYIKEHSEKRPARVKAKLKSLVDRLKSDANFRNENRVKHFLDEERDRISS